MSSPKVTLSELIEKWANITNGSEKVMHDEMTAFMTEAMESGVTPLEVMKAKSRIMSAWVALTWNEAQKRSERVVIDKNGVPQTIKWKEKKWWEDRKKTCGFIFNKVYKDVFENAKPQVSIQPKEEVQDVPTFTNLADFKAWKEKKLAVIGGV